MTDHHSIRIEHQRAGPVPRMLSLAESFTGVELSAEVVDLRHNELEERRYVYSN